MFLGGISGWGALGFAVGCGCLPDPSASCHPSHPAEPLSSTAAIPPRAEASGLEPSCFFSFLELPQNAGMASSSARPPPFVAAPLRRDSPITEPHAGLSPSSLQLLGVFVAVLCPHLSNPWQEVPALWAQGDAIPELGAALGVLSSPPTAPEALGALHSPDRQTRSSPKGATLGTWASALFIFGSSFPSGPIGAQGSACSSPRGASPPCWESGTALGGP